MGWKKKLLTALLGMMLAATVAAGIHWNMENFVLVELHFYPRNEETLDLRGEKISPARFEKLRKKLPDCEIFWDVPLSGGSVSCDAREVSLKVLSREDVPLVAYLNSLETIGAEGCSDYENLLMLEQTYPSLNIRYNVELGHRAFDHGAEEITVRGVSGESLSRLDNMRNLKSVICAGGETDAVWMLREACRERNIGFSVKIGQEVLEQETKEVTLQEVTGEELLLLPGLANLQKVHIVRPRATGAQLLALSQSNPALNISWEAEVCGVLCSSEAEELDLSEAKVESLSDMEAALDYFPNVKTVFLGKCGIANEKLAELREEKREQYKLVWTVELGKKLTARTDDTTFMPVREHVYYFNDEEAYNLRYCQEMVCIDIGHMSIHNIDFVKDMPNLEYLILAHTQLTHIEPISTCKKLKFLELDWSPIRDLSPLVGCTALEDLNLGNTFASFEPVKEMTWLKNLWVINCGGGVAYKMSQALPETKVQGSGKATVDSGWRDLPNYYAMRDLLGMHYMSW